MKYIDEDWPLIKRITAGEVDLFEEIVNRHKNKVASIVSGRVPARDFEEVCHDVFLRAFNSLEHYSAKRPFEHWLSILAVRECCDYWRRHKRSREVSASNLSEEHQDMLEVVGIDKSLAVFEKEQSRSDAADLIQQSMLGISREDRLLLELVYWEGWKLKDVAASFGWGVSRTKIRAMRVRQRLRKKIEELVLEDNGGEYGYQS